jgi:hypothetical protein
MTLMNKKKWLKMLHCDLNIWQIVSDPWFTLVVLLWIIQINREVWGILPPENMNQWVLGDILHTKSWNNREDWSHTTSKKIDWQWYILTITFEGFFSIVFLLISSPMGQLAEKSLQSFDYFKTLWSVKTYFYRSATKFDWYFINTRHQVKVAIYLSNCLHVDRCEHIKIHRYGRLCIKNRTNQRGC